MLKRARREAPVSRKANVDDRAELDHVGTQLRIALHGQHAEAPHPGQHRRSDAKRNDVGQRIQFASESAGGVGQPRNAAVEEIQDDGHSNRLGRLIEVPGIARPSPEWPARSRNNPPPCCRR